LIKHTEKKAFSCRPNDLHDMQSSVKHNSKLKV